MALRRVVLGSLAALSVGVIVTGATAFACVAPARLNLSSAKGVPGDVVTVTGSGWVMPPRVTTGVQIRWGGGYDGPLLAEAVPDDSGNFSTTFTVPEAAPGSHMVSAILSDEHGKDVAGTPARLLFEIGNPAAAPVVAPDPAPAPTTPGAVPASGSGSSFPTGMVIGLGVLGLALFGGGFVAVSRSRKGDGATPARVRRG